jgi:hypothetical protein
MKTNQMKKSDLKNGTWNLTESELKQMNPKELKMFVEYERNNSNIEEFDIFEELGIEKI